MKSIRLLFIFCNLPFLFLWNCTDDKGNYDYNWLPTISIQMPVLDTVIGRGDTLVIEPQFIKTFLNEYGDTVKADEIVSDLNHYSFSWYAIPNGKATRTLISEKWNINEPIYLPIASPARHRIELRALNQETGVTSFNTFELEVIGNYKSGFLFLTEDQEENVELEIYGLKANGEKVLEKGV